MNEWTHISKIARDAARAARKEGLTVIEAIEQQVELAAGIVGPRIANKIGARLRGAVEYVIQNGADGRLPPSCLLILASWELEK